MLGILHWCLCAHCVSDPPLAATPIFWLWNAGSKGPPNPSRSLDAALMKGLQRKLSTKSDGSEAVADVQPSSATSSEKAAGDKGFGKPPTGKGDTELEEIREKFRIVKV